MRQIINPFTGLCNPLLGASYRYSSSMTGKKIKAKGIARAVFAQNVKQLMELRYPLGRNKPKSLAIEAGVSLSTVQRAIGGETAPTLDTVEAIADVFKISPARMLQPNVSSVGGNESPAWRTGTI